MIGVVFENYTAGNGFGQETQQYGAVLKANIGIKYNLQGLQQLSFEGSHAENQLHQQVSKHLKRQYEYSF